MRIKQKLLFRFSILVLYFILNVFLFSRISYATDTVGNFTASNTGTYWGIWIKYLPTDTLNYYFDPVERWVDQNGINVITSEKYFGQYSLPGYSVGSSDRVKWHSACADPVQYISPNYYPDPTDGNVYMYNISSNCPSSNSINGNPASCNNVTNLGYISASGWCPSGPYCMYGGNTWDTASGPGHGLCPGAFNNPRKDTSTSYYAPASCGGASACTYNYCTASNFNGGLFGRCNSITDTTGAYCGASSCAGGPALTLTPTCSGTTSQIIANWSDDSSYVNYDFQYKPSSSSTWTQLNGITPPSNIYTISPLSDSTSYDVQVRAHTSPGVPGPTAWSSSTATTPNCSAPTATLTPTPTPIPAQSCTVNWGNFPATVAVGQSYTFPITFTSNFGTRMPSVYLDPTGQSLYRNSNSANSGSNSVTVNLTIPNNIPAGNYTMKPYLDNASAVGILCTTKPFTVTYPAWYQSVGGDVRQDKGISVPLPSGKYFSDSQASSPTINNGIVFTAQSSASFGSGTANQNNWLVKSDTFSPNIPGIKTSYALISSNATKTKTCTYNISTGTGTNCSTSQITPVCADVTNCSLPTTLPNATYTVNPGNVTGGFKLTASNYTFPTNGSYVFIVNGDMTISQNFTVPTSTFVMFVVKGNITVESNVTNIHGVFSADGQFTVNSNSGTDVPLNIQGNVIADANLSTLTPFVNNRNLGAANQTTPSVSITYRPDFILHAPTVIKKATYSVSEIAPVVKP